MLIVLLASIYIDFFFSIPAFKPSYQTIGACRDLVQFLDFKIPCHMRKDIGEYLTLAHETIRKAIHDNLDARGIYSARMYMNATLCIEKQIIGQNNQSTIQSDKYHITTTARLYTIPEIDSFINHCMPVNSLQSPVELVQAPFPIYAHLTHCNQTFAHYKPPLNH